MAKHNPISNPSVVSAHAERPLVLSPTAPIRAKRLAKLDSAIAAIMPVISHGFAKSGFVVPDEHLPIYAARELAQGPLSPSQGVAASSTPFTACLGFSVREPEVGYVRQWVPVSDDPASCNRVYDMVAAFNTDCFRDRNVTRARFADTLFALITSVKSDPGDVLAIDLEVFRGHVDFVAYPIGAEPVRSPIARPDAIIRWSFRDPGGDLFWNETPIFFPAADVASPFIPSRFAQWSRLEFAGMWGEVLINQVREATATPDKTLVLDIAAMAMPPAEVAIREKQKRDDEEFQARLAVYEAKKAARLAHVLARHRWTTPWLSGSTHKGRQVDIGRLFDGKLDTIYPPDHVELTLNCMAVRDGALANWKAQHRRTLDLLLRLGYGPVSLLAFMQEELMCSEVETPVYVDEQLFVAPIKDATKMRFMTVAVPTIAPESPDVVLQVGDTTYDIEATVEHLTATWYALPRAVRMDFAAEGMNCESYTDALVGLVRGTGLRGKPVAPIGLLIDTHPGHSVALTVRVTTAERTWSMTEYPASSRKVA